MRGHGGIGEAKAAGKLEKAIQGRKIAKKAKVTKKIIAAGEKRYDAELLKKLTKLFSKYSDDVGRLAEEHGNNVLKFIEKNGNSRNIKDIISIFSNEKNFEYSKFMDFMIKNDKEAVRFMKKYDVDILRKWNGELPKYWKSRASYKKGQVEKVWENAKTNPKNKFYAKNGVEYIRTSNGTVSWDKTQTRNRQWDMGHIPKQQYEPKYQQFVKKEISEKEFIEWYQTTDIYEPQTINYNRSRKGDAL